MAATECIAVIRNVSNPGYVVYSIYDYLDHSCNKYCEVRRRYLFPISTREFLINTRKNCCLKREAKFSCILGYKKIETEATV